MEWNGMEGRGKKMERRGIEHLFLDQFDVVDNSIDWLIHLFLTFAAAGAFGDGNGDGNGNGDDNDDDDDDNYNEISDVSFVKRPIHDQDILLELSSNAAFAWEASYDFNYYTTYGINRKWDLITYPDVEYGLVSKVFYNRWKRYAANFWQKLENFEKQDNSIEFAHPYTFTGFGYGGILAVFAALEYKKKYKEASVSLITFGQPRIGDELFIYHIEHILNKAWRVTNGDDWVPNFPIDGHNRERKNFEGTWSTSPKILYNHLRKEFWIDSTCDCQDNPTIYLCYHTATLYEHEECNGRNHYHKNLYPADNWEDSIKYYRELHPDNQHFGPYFKYTMLQ
ncbi:hypothetical protein G9A89_006271, partial [Geosiphon pyriformis]